MFLDFAAQSTEQNGIGGMRLRLHLRDAPRSHPRRGSGKSTSVLGFATFFVLGLTVASVFAAQRSAGTPNCKLAEQKAEAADGVLPAEQVGVYEKRAWELCKRALGPLHPRAITIGQNLAATYQELGRHRDALAVRSAIYQLLRTHLGAEDVGTLSALNDMGVSYWEAGRLPEAQRALQDAYNSRLKILGSSNEATMGTATNLATVYREVGRLREALALRELVYEWRRKSLGDSNADALLAMSNLAISLDDVGRPAEALQLRERNLDERRRVLGPNNVDTIASMQNLAISYSAAGRFSEALTVRVQAATQMLKLRGPTHPYTLAIEADLASDYGDLGRFTESLELRKRVFDARLATLGGLHHATLGSMNDLAVSYLALGRTAEALDTYRRVLELRRSTLGPGHPKVLSSMNNLAVALSSAGRLGEALRLHNEVLEGRNATLGRNHPDTISSLANIANIYSEMGRPDEARLRAEQVVEAREATGGPTHPETLSAKANLANYLNALGDVRGATSLRELVLTLRRERLGPNHPDVLSSIANLANSYAGLGREAEATELRQQVLERRRSALGERHPDTLSARQNLAESLAKLGRVSEAYELRLRMFRERTAALGSDHPDTLRSLRSLAGSLVDLKRDAEIIPLARAYAFGAESIRIQSQAQGSERQALFIDLAEGYKRFARYLGTLSTNRNLASAIRSEAAKLGFELADKSKARTMLEEMSLTQAALFNAALPGDQAAKIASARAQLSAVAERIAVVENFPKPDLLSLEALRNRERTLGAEYVSLQTRLASLFPTFGRLSQVRFPAPDDAKSLLEEDQLFMSYTVESEGPVSVWLLDSSGEPRFVQLKPVSSEIRRATSDLRSALSGFDEVGRVRVDARATGSLSSYLWDMLMAPIADALRSKRRVIIAPDSVLALLPFDAVAGASPEGPEASLRDRLLSVLQSFSVFAHLRQRQSEERRQPRYSLLAMGNAVYDAETYGSQGSTPDAHSWSDPNNTQVRRITIGEGKDSKVVTLSASSEQFAQHQLRWQNLPGSEAEIESVSSLFPAQPVETYVGHDATEEHLQRLNATGHLAEFRYILFSAHGYLAANPALSSVVLSLDQVTETADGYVTAAEWASYRLNSELVVLSACDTGVGQAIAGEGVMGLPYALLVAGNRNTLLTLWPVSDRAAAKFMERFFRRVIAGEGHTAALAATKGEFLSDPGLKDFAAPRFWAAFVLYGT